MTTTPQDRLNQLFAGQALPATVNPGERHFSELELEEKLRKDQAHSLCDTHPSSDYPHQFAKSAKTTPSTDILTSSDDDDYVSSFSKKPSMKDRSQWHSKATAHTLAKSVSEHTPSDSRLGSHSSDNRTLDQEKLEHDQSQISPTAPTQLTHQFCQFTLLSKFPYKYMNDDNDRVSRHFFANNKFYRRTWDLYYLNPPFSLGGKPLVLVPFDQVQKLVEEIGATFDIEVCVPDHPFTLVFTADGTPQPQKLGVSHSRDEAADLQSSIPATPSGHGDCPDGASLDLQNNYKQFRRMCQDAMMASRKKGGAVRKAKEGDRLLQVDDVHKQLRRCQRYLGLRPRSFHVPEPDPAWSWDKQEDHRFQQWKTAGIILDPLDLLKAAPFPFEKETVFISFDVEAYERAHNLITEVGVSTLDTLDLIGVPPGVGGINWINQIRSRHFRIRGREHYVNRTFCPGDPDSFQFGKSEFVDLQQVAERVDSCFRWPFSVQYKHAGLVDAWAMPIKRSGAVDGTADLNRNSPTGCQVGTLGFGPSTVEETDANRVAVDSVLRGTGDGAAIQRAIDLNKSSKTNPDKMQRGPKKRNILVVGHALGADLDFLKQLGSKIFSSSRGTYPLAAMDMMGTGEGDAETLASILEALDTASLYRVAKKETQTRNLASILGDLKRPAYFTHNAGNDARYTLEALVAMTVKARLEDEKTELVNAASKAPAADHSSIGRSVKSDADIATGGPLLGDPKGKKIELDNDL